MPDIATQIQQQYLPHMSKQWSWRLAVLKQVNIICNLRRLSKVRAFIKHSVLVLQLPREDDCNCPAGSKAKPYINSPQELLQDSSLTTRRDLQARTFSTQVPKEVGLEGHGQMDQRCGG